MLNLSYTNSKLFVLLTRKTAVAVVVVVVVMVAVATAAPAGAVVVAILEDIISNI